MMGLMVEILLLLVMLALFPLMTGIVSCRAAGWCLHRRLWFLVYLVLITSGIGVVYGLLRLTGVVIFPSDHAWSIDYFDASWRDDGVRLLEIFAGPLGGCAAALLLDRKKGHTSSVSRRDSQTEEKM